MMGQQEELLGELFHKTRRQCFGNSNCVSVLHNQNTILKFIKDNILNLATTDRVYKSRAIKLSTVFTWGEVGGNTLHTKF